MSKGFKLKRIILFSLIFLSGCDFLTTRNAEEPDIGRSSFVVATTPEQLFINLTDSFREKKLKEITKVVLLIAHF